jgi:HlyD family secretion protein
MSGTPDDLEELLDMSDRRGWLALIALWLVVVAVVAWALLGTITTRVEGFGILIRSGGIAAVDALGTGQVTKLHVAVGDTVHKGQTVAELAQKELIDQIDKAKSTHAELTSEVDRNAELGTEQIRLRAINLAQQRAVYKGHVENLRDQVKTDEERVAAQTKLREQGLVTKQSLLSARDQLDSTKEEIQRTLNLIQQLDENENELRTRLKQERMASDRRLSEVKRNIAALEERLLASSRVVSPYSGRVLEVRTSEGSLVTAGAPILSLERFDEAQKLRAVLYLGAGDGKKVRPGMEVQIVPATIRVEEQGYLLGRAGAVAEFPSTKQGMLRVLGNEELVASFLRRTEGAPIEVEAEPIEEGDRLKWSSRNGPKPEIGPGTPCKASITLGVERPIVLLLPMLRGLVER